MILPALVVLVAIVIWVAQITLTGQAVNAAAGQAARAASLERGVAEGRVAAKATGETALREAGVECRPYKLDLDLDGLNAPIGRPAAVSVTITCVVRNPVQLPGLSATRTVVAKGTSPVDTYRGR